jgi:hypothetical protein
MCSFCDRSLSPEVIGPRRFWALAEAFPMASRISLMRCCNHQRNTFVKKRSNLANEFFEGIISSNSQNREYLMKGKAVHFLIKIARGV